MYDNGSQYTLCPGKKWWGFVLFLVCCFLIVPCCLIVSYTTSDMNGFNAYIQGRYQYKTHATYNTRHPPPDTTIRVRFDFFWLGLTHNLHYCIIG